MAEAEIQSMESGATYSSFGVELSLRRGADQVELLLEGNENYTRKINTPQVRGVDN